MEFENIKKLMDEMGNSKLTSIDIEFPDGTKICMKKENKEILVQSTEKYEIPTSNVTSVKEVETVKENKVVDNGRVVKSPMVGTFYSKPSPDAEAFVKVGSSIVPGTVLCIIEAMKLMNEIEAEESGEIAEVLVKDGEYVEYGTPLFRLK